MRVRHVRSFFFSISRPNHFFFVRTVAFILPVQQNRIHFHNSCPKLQHSRQGFLVNQMFFRLCLSVKRMSESKIIIFGQKIITFCFRVGSESMKKSLQFILYRTAHTVVRYTQVRVHIFN